MAHVKLIIRTAGLLTAIGLLWSAAVAQSITESEKGVWTTGEMKASLVLGKMNRIVIRSASAVSGSLEITTGFVKDAQLTYTKIAKTESRSKASDFLDALSVSLDAFGGRARLEFRAPNPAPWNGPSEAGIVRGKLVLPQGAFVEIDAGSFDIKATGPLAGLVVVNSLGQIEASRIDSVVDITTANQKVALNRISGDISVSTANAPLTATQINATRMAARFKNESGDIKLDAVSGSLNVRANMGKISISAFDASGEGTTVKGTSGPISIALTGLKGGQFMVSNKLEDIELLVPKSISAYLSLSAEEEDKIEVTDLLFRAELVQRDRLNLIVGKGETSVSCSVKGQGGIFVRGVSSE